MIFFFHGPNTYEARKQIAGLIRQYKQKTGSDLGLERVDGAKVALGDLRASLTAMPFLATSRLVIIEGMAANKAVAPKIADLVTGTPDSTVAVFYDPQPDKRSTYYKTLSKTARTVEFQPLPLTKLQHWVQSQARERGATIGRPALNRLLELAGEDQWRLSGEIAKLAEHGPDITAQLVDAHVAANRNESIFNLVEAMTSGRQRPAMQMYHHLRASGESEMYILSMVIWQLRNMLLAKAAGRISPPELAKEAGMSPYVAGNMLSARHRLSEESLQQAFLAAVDTDFRIKSGGGEAAVLVGQLIAGVGRRLAA